MNRLLSTAGLIIVLFIISAPANAAEIIKMGYFNLIPHAFYDSSIDEAQGASIDYFNRIALSMGYEVEWSGPLPFPRLIRYLKEGLVDGSILMSRNSQREAFLYYPRAPYHGVHRILVLKRENPLLKITSIQNILGYRIGFLEGGHLSAFIKENKDKINLELIGGEDWVKQNLLKLRVGRLDAVYDLNAETMLYMAKKMNMDHTIKILKLPEPPGGVNIVFSKASQKGRGLLESYHQVLERSKIEYTGFLRSYLYSDPP